MQRLSDDDVRDRLTTLPGWALGAGEIEKRYEFADFPAAVAFVVRVGFEAEAANHHPDLDVRWNKVRVALATHSERAITTKDLELAAAIEALTSA